jgi:heme oxygenase (biliverdin-IX-beta and delta-forming)
MMAQLTRQNQTLNILEKLRAGTHRLHLEMERDLDLLRPGLRLEEYTQLLERFYGFYIVCEPPVNRSLGQIPGLDLHLRAKIPSLTDDLVYLGHESTSLARLPRCVDLPALRSPAMALGWLYVTEGSTLGGRLLARHFQKTLGLRPGGGATFFSSYGDELASMWNRFRSVLLEETDADNEADILCGAIQTFECMHAWLCSQKAAFA